MLCVGLSYALKCEWPQMDDYTVSHRLIVQKRGKNWLINNFPDQYFVVDVVRVTEEKSFRIDDVDSVSIFFFILFYSLAIFYIILLFNETLNKKRKVTVCIRNEFTNYRRT